MTTIRKTVLALSLLALAGCKANEAMDNTATMKNDLGAMKTTTQGMADTTNGMNTNMQDLKRQATLGEGLKMLNDPENGKEYAPPSAGLMAGAKLLAENMTEDELVDFFVVRLKEINATTPNSLRKVPGAISGYFDDYIYEFNKAKQVKVVGLKAIAAQVPLRENGKGTVSIEGLIRDQIYGAGGARADEVLVLLAMRAAFINDFFLDSNVFATGKLLDNVGKLRKAYGYAKELQFLADLPFVNEIAFTTAENAFLPTIFPPAKKRGEKGCESDDELNKNPECKPTSTVPAFNDRITGKITPADWFFKISSRIETEMPDRFKAANSPYAREVSEIKADCDRLSGD